MADGCYNCRLTRSLSFRLRKIGDGSLFLADAAWRRQQLSSLFDQFAAAFGDADHAFILPIYRPMGREVDAREVTSLDLVHAIQRHGQRDVRLVESFDRAVEAVLAAAKPGDLVITMGAGDVTLLSHQLVEALSA